MQHVRKWQFGQIRTEIGLDGKWKSLCLQGLHAPERCLSLPGIGQRIFQGGLLCQEQVQSHEDQAEKEKEFEIEKVETVSTFITNFSWNGRTRTVKGWVDA